MPPKLRVETEIQRAARFLRTARKAMHDPSDAMRRPMLFDERQRVVPGFTRVDHNGLFGRSRDSHLFDEHRFLDFARRKIVVIVETDFAHREHLGVRQKIREMSEIVRSPL